MIIKAVSIEKRPRICVLGHSNMKRLVWGGESSRDQEGRGSEAGGKPAEFVVLRAKWNVSWQTVVRYGSCYRWAEQDEDKNMALSFTKGVISDLNKRSLHSHWHLIHGNRAEKEELTLGLFLLNLIVKKAATEPSAVGMLAVGMAKRTVYL